MVIDLISFPFLLLVIFFQVAIISRISLIAGYADLMMVTLAAWALQKQVPTAWHWAIVGGLFVAVISRLPWIVPLVGYFLVVGLARLFQRRIWHAPLFAMFLITFLGTLIMHFLSIVALFLMGDPLPVGDSLGLVTLPSLFINLILAIPVFVIMRDISKWLYPVEVEE